MNQTLQRIHKIGLMIRDTTKTDGSQRTIAVSESVIAHLRQIEKQQKKEKLLAGRLYEDHDLIFAKADGTPIEINQMSFNFGRWIKRLNLPPISFHGLRHLHATLMLQNGVHPKIVSERLGHSKASFTMDVYSHVLPNMQKEAAQKLDNFLYGNDSESTVIDFQRKGS